MSDEALYKPKNQERDKLYNREPGIAIVQGSNYALEMEKFEQFPSKYGSSPGNPYVFRQFPLMLYRAEHFNGSPRCMAAQPNPAEYTNPKEYDFHADQARRFTERCQMIVKNEGEMARAFENGWRESPAEAVEHLVGRDRARSTGAAERAHQDRNMSEKAKAEAAQKVAEAGMHLDAIPESPVPPKPKRKYTRRKKAS